MFCFSNAACIPASLGVTRTMSHHHNDEKSLEHHHMHRDNESLIVLYTYTCITAKKKFISISHHSENTHTIKFLQAEKIVPF